MSRRASVSAAIATLAMSLGAFAPTSNTAYAATCNAAPKPAAPQGQHWYYRTDRNLGRKCWYLAAEGRKGQAAATQPAATEPDEDDVDVAKPAAPPMAEAAARLTEPLRSPPPAARPAAESIVAQAAPSAPPVTPADTAQRSDEPAATLAPEPVMVQEPAPEQAMPVAAPSAAPAVAPAPERINLMQFVFVAFVGICLLAGLFFYVVARRRRSEIRIVDLNTMSLRAPPMTALTDSPSVAPDASRRDEAQIDDEPLRRFSQAWKRQVA